MNGKAPRSEREPKHHRTIDRVVRLLEEVVFNPGISFGELCRKLGLPKSTLHSFIEGLLAAGWLYEQEDQGQVRLYLGPAIYGLTVSSGQVRAGQVTTGDLYELQRKIGVEVYLGVLVGDSLIYVAEAGGDPVGGLHSRNFLRRKALESAGGKVLLASRADAEIDMFLRRRPESEKAVIEDFANEVPRIRRTGIATNFSQGGRRLGIAGTVRNASGTAIASLTAVGPADKLEPRIDQVSAEILAHLQKWRSRMTEAREAV